MTIRTRLTLQFTIVVSLIIIACFLFIYLFLAHNRKEEFYSRLENKIKTRAELLSSDRGMDSAKIRLFDRSQRDTLASHFMEIYTLDGQLVYTNKEKVSYPFNKDWIDILEGGGSLRFKDNKYEMLANYYKGKSRDFVLISGAIDAQSKEKNKFLLELFLFLCPFSVLIVGFSIWLIAKKAFDPVVRLIKQIDEISVESMDKRLELKNRDDEIGILSQRFNGLLSRIQTAMNLQRIFLSAASHEMKNPLTSITTQLQVLQLKARTTENYQEAISSVLQDLTELNKSTNNLIEFARLTYEMNKELSLQALRIDDVLWHSIEYFTKLNPASNIKVKFEKAPSNEQSLIIQANETLLKTAFTNLMENSYKFGNGEEIMIELESTTDGIEISFADKGIGITQEDQEHIFEPFYRVNQSSYIKGHGLGLALVRKILFYHQATIKINSELGKGSNFILFFPR